jgi:hypothetical protein
VKPEGVLTVKRKNNYPSMMMLPVRSRGLGRVQKEIDFETRLSTVRMANVPRIGRDTEVRQLPSSVARSKKLRKNTFFTTTFMDLGRAKRKDGHTHRKFPPQR